MSGIGNNLLLQQFYRIHTFMLFTVFSGCPLTPIRQIVTDQLRVSNSYSYNKLPYDWLKQSRLHFQTVKQTKSQMECFRPFQ